MKSPRPQVAIATLFALVGCHSADRPGLDGRLARQTDLRTISATLTATVHLGDGDPVETEGVLVARPPRHFAIQLWKLSGTVFDLRSNPNGVWVVDRVSNGMAADADLVQQSPENILELMTTGMSLASRLRARGGAARDCLSAQRRGERVECCRSVQARGAQEPQAEDEFACRLIGRRVDGLAEVRLGQFSVVGSMEWPMRVSIRSGDLHLHIAFDQVEINEPLSPNAFSPPKNSRRL